MGGCLFVGVDKRVTASVLPAKLLDMVECGLLCCRCSRISAFLSCYFSVVVKLQRNSHGLFNLKIVQKTERFATNECLLKRFGSPGQEEEEVILSGGVPGQ